MENIRIPLVLFGYSHEMLKYRYLTIKHHCLIILSLKFQEAIIKVE